MGLLFEGSDYSRAASDQGSRKYGIHTEREQEGLS